MGLSPPAAPPFRMGLSFQRQRLDSFSPVTLSASTATQFASVATGQDQEGWARPPRDAFAFSSPGRQPPVQSGRGTVAVACRALSSVTPEPRLLQSLCTQEGRAPSCPETDGSIRN